MHSLVLCYPLVGTALSIFYSGPAASEPIPMLHAGGPDTTGRIARNLVATQMLPKIALPGYPNRSPVGLKY